MEKQYTNGPWALNKYADGDMDITSNGVDICYIANNETSKLGDVESNARLIAAAPELLAALEHLTNEAEKRGGVPRSEIDNARAAIVKATGS